MFDEFVALVHGMGLTLLKIVPILIVLAPSTAGIGKAAASAAEAAPFRTPRRDRLSMALLRFLATMARKADAVYRVTVMTVAESLCGL